MITYLCIINLNYTINLYELRAESLEARGRPTGKSGRQHTCGLINCREAVTSGLEFGVVKGLGFRV